MSLMTCGYKNHDMIYTYTDMMKFPPVQFAEYMGKL